MHDDDANDKMTNHVIYDSYIEKQKAAVQESAFRIDLVKSCASRKLEQTV